MPSDHAVTSYGGSGGDVGRAPHLRVGLLLEHVLGVAREDLRHRDHERAGRVRLAVGLERRVGAIDLDAAHAAASRPGAPPRADRAGARPGRGSPTDRPSCPSSIVCAVDLVDLPQHRLAPIRRRLEQRHRRDQLVVDDVAERPVAAHPGPRIFGARGDVGRRRQRSRPRTAAPPPPPSPPAARRRRRAPGRARRAADRSARRRARSPPR